MSAPAHDHPLSPRKLDCQEVDSILCGPDTKKVFGTDRWFSSSSSADVFEIRGGKGVLRSNLDGVQISTLLEGDRSPAEKVPVHLRIIFIDGVEGDTDRLHITPDLLQKVFTTYNISPRVVRFLRRQHMPGRVVKYDQENQTPIHHQFWYSTIIRSYQNIPGGIDNSKWILGWKRLLVWAGHDISRGVTTVLALRCPADMKANLVAAFADRGRVVKQQPMLLHAFFVQNALQKADKFSESWADPIYEWELKVNELYSAEDFTARSRAFLKLAREITQVQPDYDILLATLQHLKTEHKWIRDHLDTGTKELSPSVSSSDLSEFNDDIWDVLTSECELLKSYGRLYETRTKIGINECFAMVNQRDSELNIQMAAESTQIARVSHLDGKSLRVIQILTMVFLPASLCSGIFGMGFFNTSPDADGNTTFSVSSNWWWYPALTLPLTAFILLLSMGGWQTFESWHTKRRGSLKGDVEKQVV